MIAIGCSMTGIGLGTAFAYGLASRLRIPKSAAAAVLLPFLVEHYARSAAERFESLCLPDFNSLGLNPNPGFLGTSGFVEGLKRTVAVQSLPSRFRDFVRTPDDVIACIDAAQSLGPVSGPIQAQDLFTMAKQAF